MEKVYTRIKELRIQRGMSQDELGTMAGYKSGRAMISKIELGKCDIPLDKLIAIAKALGVSPAYLTGLETEGTSKMQEEYIFALFSKLNPQGRKKAKEYMELLAQNKDFTVYKKSK